MNSHGTLYKKARSVFGCRVKRVWFQLNPFLERTKVKEDEVGVYQPSSKFVLPLQSIVLCEDLNSESDPDWTELSPASFWDYLYSSSWGDECSLRVMEGELLELLLATLFTLERDQQVVSHNTFAYTTNTRIKPTCFKQSETTKDDIINETLLVDFTYYGKRTRELDMDFSGSTAYPFSLTSSRGFSSDYTSTSLESSDGAMPVPKPPPVRVNLHEPTLPESEQRGGDFAIRPPKSVKFDSVNINIVDSGLLGIKGPLRAIPVTALANASPFDNSGSMLIKSFIRESSQLLAKRKPSSHHSKDKSSEHDRSSPTRGKRGSGQQSKMPTVFEGRNKRQPSSTPDAAPGGSQASESTTEHSESSDTGLPLLEFNLAKLPCSERTKAGLENWQLDKFAYIRRPPGDEYYLRINDTSTENLSPREKLLKDRKRMQGEREARRQEMERRKKFFEKKPPKPIEYKDDDKPLKPVVKFFTHAPSFTEFLHWLEEENKYDPRYKKHKQRKKKIVKKYKLRTSEVQITHMESSTTKSSRSSVRESSIDTGSSIADDINYTFRSGKGSSKTLYGRRMTIPGTGSGMIRFAEEAGGVTDSPAVKNTIIANGRALQAEEEEEVAPLGGHTSRGTPRQRRWSVCADSSTNQPDIMEERENKQKPLEMTDKSSSPRLSPQKGSNSASPQKGSNSTLSGSSPKISSAGSGSKSGVSLFRKNEFKAQGRELDLETESADTESDEDDELEDSLFDSNKLNKRYSFEKLKGKNSQKKKPIFFDILKKYYRVQKAMSVLRGQSSKKSSVITNASQKTPPSRKPPANLLRRLSHRPVKPKKDIVLGKLKSFGFQQYNNHKAKVPEVVLPDFTTYPKKEFFVNLLKALDDFVIRKENVISSYGLETLTTVTLTRPGVFNKMVHVD